MDIKISDKTKEILSKYTPNNLTAASIVLSMYMSNIEAAAHRKVINEYVKTKNYEEKFLAEMNRLVDESFLNNVAKKTPPIIEGGDTDE